MNDTYNLKIGVFAYDMEQSKSAMRYLIDNNYDDVVLDESNVHFVTFKDGAKFYNINLINNIKGLNLDQLFIFDDKRWNIFKKYFTIIDCLKMYALRNSCVPDEFKVIKYENMV